MIRKFAAALFAVSTLSSSVAMALGLGEAKVNSTLNQPLNAEIELISVRDLTSAEILPGLASREDFVRAGIERPHLLSDLKFNVVFKDPNTAVIRLSSQKPIREPFLNFLVEVVWPNGRLLREYALLIDPPMFAQEPASAVAPAMASAQPAPVVRRDPTPQTVASPSMYSASMSYGDDRRTLKTSGSDTLWHIAQQNRPSGRATTQQTMLAIQDLNPSAFIDNNINLMKAGQVLRMPTQEDVDRRSADQAVAEVRAQNRAFAEKQALRGRQIDATGRTASSAPAQQATTEGVLKIVAADGSAEANPGQATGGKSGSAASGGGSEQQLDLAMEELDKTARENRELQNRLQELEAQLETLQKLVTLKDDQLALLQAQTGVSDEAGLAPQAEALDASAELAATETQPTEEELISAISELAAAETEQPVTDVDAQSATEPAMQAEADVVEAEIAEGAVAQVEAPAPVDVTPVSVPAELPPPSKSFLEQVLSDPLYKGIAGGSVVLLLIILWLASRHNANKEKAFQAQLATAGGAPLDDDEAIDLGQSDRRAASGAVAAGVGLGAMAAVAGAQDEENADVLAEAEAYMAYGRLEYAAQLLEDELKNNPDRNDVRLKLLEVYSQGGNGEAFEEQFAVLEASGDGEAISAAEELRARMNESEPELSLDDLENELLSGGASAYQAPEASAVEEASVVEEASATDDVDEVEAVEEEPAVAPAQESDPLQSLEEDFLNLDETEVAAALEEVAAEVESVEAESDELDIDFDLSELDLDSLDETPAEPVAESVQAESAEASDLELMDFDLGELEETSEVSEQPVELGLETLTDAPAAEAGAEFGEMNFEEAPLLEESAEESFTLDLVEEDPEVADEDGLALDAELEAPELDMSDDEVAELLDAGAESLSEELAESLDEVEAELGDDLAISDELLEGLESTPESLEQEDDQAVVIPVEGELDEEDFDFLAGTDEAATKLDLARAYIDMGDLEGARDILEEVTKEGNEQQQQEAAALLKTLD